MTSVEFNSELMKLYPNLERFAYSLSSNAEDARDLLQDTYLRALKYREQFESNTNIKAWLFTIMKNTFINNYRRAKTKKMVLDNTDNLSIINGKSDCESPESRLSHSEICTQVNQLNDDFRILFQMHTEGYKYREIAEKLNLNIGTVKSRIHFSRQRLSRALHNYI